MTLLASHAVQSCLWCLMAVNQWLRVEVWDAYLVSNPMKSSTHASSLSMQVECFAACHTLLLYLVVPPSTFAWVCGWVCSRESSSHTYPTNRGTLDVLRLTMPTSLGLAWNVGLFEVFLLTICLEDWRSKKECWWELKDVKRTSPPCNNKILEQNFNQPLND